MCIQKKGDLCLFYSHESGIHLRNVYIFPCMVGTSIVLLKLVFSEWPESLKRVQHTSRAVYVKTRASSRGGVIDKGLNYCCLLLIVYCCWLLLCSLRLERAWLPDTFLNGSCSNISTYNKEDLIKMNCVWCSKNRSKIFLS